MDRCVTLPGMPSRSLEGGETGAGLRPLSPFSGSVDEKPPSPLCPHGVLFRGCGHSPRDNCTQKGTLQVALILSLFFFT